MAHYTFVYQNELLKVSCFPLWCWWIYMQSEICNTWCKISSHG